MAGRKKLTEAQQAKRDAKRARRAEGEAPAAPAGPSLGTLIARDDLVRRAQKHTAGLIAESTAFVDDAAKTHLAVISCHTCTAPKGCCKLTLAMLFHEALPVADRVRRDGRDTPALRARLLQSAELMEAHSTADYRALVRPCVFLDSEERCTVYEQRPRECGAAFVLSPPEHCSDLAIDSIEVVRQPLGHTRARLLETEKSIELALGLTMLRGPYMGVFPRLVLLWLEAWDRSDFAAYLAERIALASERMPLASG